MEPGDPKKRGLPIPLAGIGLFSVFVLSYMVWKALTMPNENAERAKIEKAIHATIGWAKNKDFDLAHSVIAHDEDFLEVDPENRIVRGFEEFKKAEMFFRSPDFKAIRYEIRDLKITLSRSGDVAWYYGVLDDANEWKGRPACWMNTRWTGVLEKRDGKWVIVLQMHFSFASDS